MGSGVLVAVAIVAVSLVVLGPLIAARNDLGQLTANSEPLQAGEIILAGSFTRALFGHKGDTFHADYRPLGAVTFRFM